MSSEGLSFINAPQIDAGASEAQVGTFSAPRTNQALQLADTLAGLEPKLTGLATAVAKEDQEVQLQAARKEAIRLGGMDLAEAVRSGKLEATQNPFFIQDYNRESAYLKAQQDIANLRADSATWAERSDPVAFQQRYTKELAAIGQKYGNDPDSNEGFSAAAYPAMQQDFAANTAEKVDAIKTERLDNMANLVAQQVAATSSKAGGKPAPGTIWNNLSGLKQQFLSTGGTSEQWDGIVLNGITSAALQQKNPGLLEALKDSGSGTSGAIYNLPGKAQDIETTRYRIVQDSWEQGQHAFQMQQQADYEQTHQLLSALYAKYGTKLLTGDVNPQDLQDDITQSGASGFAAIGALNKVQGAVADFQSLGEARFKAFANGDQGAKELLDLHMRAITQGYTEDMEHEVSSLVLDRQISEATGLSIINQAISTSEKTGKPVALGGLPKNVRKMLGSYTSTGYTVDNQVKAIVDKTNMALRKSGAPELRQSDIDRVIQAARDTAKYYLSADANRTDYRGAVQEASNAAADTLRAIIKARTSKKKSAAK